MPKRTDVKKVLVIGSGPIVIGQTAEENYATIRAIHPWGEAYFYHEITALAPNPHKTFVETNNTKYTNPGTITSVDADKKSISVLCEGGKILKMDDVVSVVLSDLPVFFPQPTNTAASASSSVTQINFFI